MEDEVCVEKGGLLQVDQRLDIRRVEANGLQRRLAATARYYICCWLNWKEASFLFLLKSVFLLCIGWISIISFVPSFAFATSTVALVVCVVIKVKRKIKMKTTASSLQRKVEMKTISGLIQQEM